MKDSFAKVCIKLGMIRKQCERCEKKDAITSNNNKP